MWKTLCSEPSSPASLAAASLGCPPVCFCLPPATNDSRLTNAAAAPPPPPPPPPPLIPVCCLPSTLLHITGFSKMASVDLFGASSKQHLSLGSSSSNERTFFASGLQQSKANASQCKSSKSAQPNFFSNTNKGLYSKHLSHTSPALLKPRFTSSDADEVRCNQKWSEMRNGKDTIESSWSSDFLNVPRNFI